MLPGGRADRSTSATRIEGDRRYSDSCCASGAISGRFRIIFNLHAHEGRVVEGRLSYTKVARPFDGGTCFVVSSRSPTRTPPAEGVARHQTSPSVRAVQRPGSGQA